MEEEGLLVTDIAGSLGPEWLEGFNEEIQSMVETEKARYHIRQGAIAAEEHRIGRQMLDGLGQKIAAVDAKTFFRWHQQEPGCWWDRGFVKSYLKDNEEAKVPGYWHGLR